MKSEGPKEPAMPNAFTRFDTAMKAILSVPKAAVVEEEKRQQERRRAGREARHLRRKS